MEFETPEWATKITTPKQECIDQIHTALLEAMKTALKNRPDKPHSDEVVDSLETSDMRVSIDENGRDEELGLFLAAMKKDEASFWSRLLAKKFALRETFSEPESIELLGQLTEEQRIMLANALVPAFCKTWEGVSLQETKRKEAAKEEDREEEPEGANAKKASRLARRVKMDLGKVYKRIAGVA